MPPWWDLDDDTLDNDYILYDDLLLDVKNYTGVLDLTANIPANHENTSSVSTDQQVQGLVEQIRDLARRDFLTPASPSPRAASPARPLSGAVGGPSSRGASPPSGGGALPKTGRLSPAPVPATEKGDHYAQQHESSISV